MADRYRELLAELVMRSSFPPDETERVRAESLDALIARVRTRWDR